MANGRSVMYKTQEIHRQTQTETQAHAHTHTHGLRISLLAVLF